MSRSVISTGWFGVPGENRSTKVHVVKDGKPICGAQVGPKMVFQWCARGTHWGYIDCEHCKAMTRRLVA